ncbi:MAG: CotH kinase family protein [Agathobacter sp.]|nr:CotH kinase family protein [Agathobacter sp.]
MKYKIISVVLVIAMLLGCLVVQNIKPDKNRYHQHIEAAEKKTCTDHGEEIFCTHLPLLNIVTDDVMPSPYVLNESGDYVYDASGDRVKNDEVVGATIQYFDSSTENNHLVDVATIEERATIRIRGTSSRDYDKNGYLIEFKEENLIDNKKVSLSGMTADSEWVLHGPFLDKTLIRNYLCYNLAGEMMDYAPNVRFCEAFLNGEYMGVYLIVEKIEYNANGRINIEKADPDMEQTAYIIEIDRKNEVTTQSIETFSRYSYTNYNTHANAGYMKIVYPGIGLTEAQKQYIIDDISKFEKALYSFDYNDKDKGYEAYIDVDSFVDYFLINEFTLNYDAMELSKYFYKNIGGKITMCVWDFNSAFDYYEYTVVSPETFMMQSSLWYNYLFKDEAFVERVVSRYFQLRESVFSEEYLYKYIDDTVAYLGPAIERNYEKWGYSFLSEYNGKNYDYLVPESRNVRSYDEAISQLKDCIHTRISHMDANMERLYTLSHDSLNKRYNYDKEAN